MLRALSRASRRDPALAHKVSGASLLLSGGYSVLAVAHAQYAAVDAIVDDDFLLPAQHGDARRHYAPARHYDAHIQRPFRFATKAELLEQCEADEVAVDVDALESQAADVSEPLLATDDALGVYLQQIRALTQIYEKLPTRETSLALEQAAQSEGNACTLALQSEAMHRHLLRVLRRPYDDQLARVAQLLDAVSHPLSTKTFNLIMVRLTRLRHDAAAWATFRAMLKLGYVPDQYTVAAVLNLCVATGARDEFEKVIATLRVGRRVANRRAKSARHASHRAGNDVGEASASAVETRGAHGARSPVVLGCLIKGCVRFGQLRRAETYARLMRGEGQGLNQQVLTCLVQGYTRAIRTGTGPNAYAQRHVATLFDLAQQPEHRDGAWDDRTVQALLKYATKTGQPALRAQVAEMAAEMGHDASPSITTQRTTCSRQRTRKSFAPPRALRRDWPASRRTVADALA